MIERSRRVRARGGKTLTGSGKKVGCPSNFVVRYPNVALIHAALPGGDTIDGFVRVAWSSEKHSAECADVKSTRVSRGALRTISQLTRQNPKHTDREIVEKYKQIIRDALMAYHEVKDSAAFDVLVQKGNIRLSRDYFMDSWTVKSIRAKEDERSWKFSQDEMSSIIFHIGLRANAFVLKFKRLEFDVTESGELRIVEKRPCAWCASKLDSTAEQHEHMKACVEKYGANTSETWIEKWCVGERWRESFRLKMDRERVNKLQSQWVQSEKKLVRLEMDVHDRKPDICGPGSIVSPIKPRLPKQSDTDSVNTLSTSATDVIELEDVCEEYMSDDDELVEDRPSC